MFAGQYVGIREVSDKIWLVSFMQYDLGFFWWKQTKGWACAQPFLDRSVTYLSGIKCDLCARYTPSLYGAPGRIRTSDHLVRSQ